jgi:hypothetical protein
MYYAFNKLPAISYSTWLLAYTFANVVFCGSAKLLFIGGATLNSYKERIAKWVAEKHCGSRVFLWIGKSPGLALDRIGVAIFGSAYLAFFTTMMTMALIQEED